MKKFDLKKERKKHGLTQKQVSIGTGFGLRTVNRHENDGCGARQELVYESFFRKIEK